MSNLKETKAEDIDLSNLTVDQLKDMQHQIKVELQTKERDEVIGLYEAMESQAQALGFENLEALRAKYDEYIAEKKKSSKSRTPVEPVYRNKANDKETWTGRGKPPRWLNNIAQERGVEVAAILEEFRI